MRLSFVGALLSVLSLSIVGAPHLAHACTIRIPFDIKHIRQADVVFRGKLIRYERVSATPPWPIKYGLLTIRVDEVLKGKASGDIQLYWLNSTFGLPSEMERPESL